MQKNINIVLLFCFVFPLTGCHKGIRLEGLVPVEGVVYYKEKPLGGANVNFIPDNRENRSAVGTTDAGGKFVMMTLNPGDGAAPGEYKVAVSKLSQPDLSGSMNMTQASRAKDAVTSLIPENYAVPGRSGLTVTVPAQGVKDLKFELK